MFVLLFERKRESAQAGERCRERERILSYMLNVEFKLHAQCEASTGLNPTTQGS